MASHEEEKPSRGFKVQDRRRFVDDAEPPTTAESAPAADTERSEPSRADAAPHADAATGDAATGDAAERYAPGAHDEEPHHEINFTTFVMGLTTQALLLSVPPK